MWWLLLATLELSTEAAVVHSDIWQYQNVHPEFKHFMAGIWDKWDSNNNVQHLKVHLMMFLADVLCWEHKGRIGIQSRVFSSLFSSLYMRLHQECHCITTSCLEWYCTVLWAPLTGNVLSTKWRMLCALCAFCHTCSWHVDYFVLLWETLIFTEILSCFIVAGWTATSITDRN